MDSESTKSIPPHGYRITVEEVMGAMFWTYKMRDPSLGWAGAPQLSGMVYPGDCHTEDPVEVFGYITNEIGATFG